MQQDDVGSILSDHGGVHFQVPDGHQRRNNSRDDHVSELTGLELLSPSSPTSTRVEGKKQICPNRRTSIFFFRDDEDLEKKHVFN